jgi:hypothetical protein
MTTHWQANAPSIAARSGRPQTEHRCVITNIPPFFRGYRIALRDVQCATERYTKAQARDEAPILALFMVADCIATELWELHSAKGEARKILSDSDWRFRGHVLDTKDLKFSLTPVIFGRGYKAGFDRALQIMTHHAWKMNDPAARIGILEMVMRFERARFEIALDEDGKIRTLRARKFAV